MSSNTTFKIDTKSPVLVTGATGYVAGVLIQQLLEQGVTVHATVRDLSNTSRFQHLVDIADANKSNGCNIKFFKGDLLTPHSFEDAMKGCSVVFHTASPFAIQVKDPQKELVEPAVKGTVNVLQTATRTPTVKRVVLTSSVMAMCTDAVDCKLAPGGVLNESVWNTTASLHYQPYPFSKTQAEQAAWIEAGSQTQWTLAVINPGFIMGPATKYHASSESWEMFKSLVDGTFSSGIPRFGVGVVDVRDVAAAHIAAAYTPDASGRHLCVGADTDFYDMIHGTLYEKYGKEYSIPKSTAPWWLVWLIGPYLKPTPLERRYVYGNVNVPFHSDTTKAQTKLGVKFRPVSKTIQDMMEQLIEFGGVEPTTQAKK